MQNQTDPQNNVVLNILAEQSTPAGESHALEMMTEGLYYERDGVKYLEYEESEDDNSEPTKTTLSMDGALVSILRSGASYSHMVFERGRRSYNTFSTPLGSMEMGVLPLNMHVETDDEGGQIELEYELDFAGRHVGTNLISISYRVKPPRAGRH